MPRPYAEPFASAVGVGQGWWDVIQVPARSDSLSAVYKVPSQWVIRPYALAYRIVTTSTTSNRGVIIRYEDPDGIPHAAFPPPALISTAVNQVVCFVAGSLAQTTFFAQGWLAPMGVLFVQGGHQINFMNINLNANDRVTDMRIAAEVFPSGGERSGRPRRPRRAVR